MTYTYTIPLPPVTKKNSPQIIYIGKKCPACHRGYAARVMPSAAYIKYQRAAEWYLTPKPQTPLAGHYCVTTVFYMPTRRKCDLSNLIEAVHDLLVHAKILADDNYAIIASVDGSRVFYDKETPRTEITITEMEMEE